MTRRSMTWLMVLVVLFVGAPSLMATDLDEVIAKHIEARGGDRWDDVASMQITGQYTAFSETYPFKKQHKDYKWADIVARGATHPTAKHCITCHNERSPSYQDFKFEEKIGKDSHKFQKMKREHACDHPHSGGK